MSCQELVGAEFVNVHPKNNPSISNSEKLYMQNGFIQKPKRMIP